MSIILNALEKAQRDNRRKKDGITEEEILQPVSAMESASHFSWKIFLGIIFLNIVIISFVLGFFLYKKMGFMEREGRLAAQTGTESSSAKQPDPVSTALPSTAQEEPHRGPVYREELTLDSGLRLMVNGVYLDNGVPYALIGPDIVKAGDMLEGEVEIISIDFKKVEVEYRKVRYFLTVK